MFDLIKLGGALANSIGAVLNTPIDVVKTRIQKQMKFETQHHVDTDFHTPRYKGTFDCFKRILLDEVLFSFIPISTVSLTIKLVIRYYRDLLHCSKESVLE